jgi:hypothetical protein
MSFSCDELKLLNKGPAYIPPQTAFNISKEQVNKAEVQSCYDRVKRKNSTLANSTEFTEFLCSVNRITQQASKPNSRSEKQTIRLIKEIRNKGIPIMPSDKTKRLIALNQEDYQNMLKEALNEDDKIVRNCLPTTIQQKFNSSLSQIIGKYPRSSFSKRLSACLTSEPLPSKPYALPKDHKPGQLKGRPIISTCNSVVRPLAQLLADILYPLIPKFVPAHLDSTKQFVQIVKGLPCGPQYSFGSLDVVNLYGSIPLEDGNGVLGLVTFLCDFFSAHKMESIFPILSTEDFKTLIKMCLYEDRYLFNGECRKQMDGIAMGNCAAPPFAIIYMHHIEEMIRTRHSGIIIWCRYIDDIFFVVEGDSESLCSTANTVNSCIQFTLEKPADNKIPFLDTLVHLEDGRFQLELFIKPTHSGTCLTFDSHAPLSRKKSLVISEESRLLFLSNI